MSARQDIGQLLEQWRRLTQEEAAAIQSADWPSLAQIQTAKAGLQKNLELERQRRSQDSPASGQPAIQAQIARLISLETRNTELLAAQTLRARAEQAALDQAQRTLRKIQRSYSFQSRPTGWDFYS
jgi:hypothetical protein